MKKVLSLLIVSLFLSISNSTYAYYDFSIQTSSGQTLFYTIDYGNNVKVVAPGSANDWIGFTKPIGNLVIPNNITYNNTSYAVIRIENFAFRDCSGLTSVSIPDNVTKIGDAAFSGCSALINVNIPTNATYIGSEAFLNCTNLTSISIPSTVTEIGLRAFKNCSGLTTVTYNAVNCTTYYSSAANSPFNGCSGITSISFGNSVTYIRNYLCYGLSNITSVTFGNNVQYIGEKAFYECSGISRVTIPNSVTQIANYAFIGCSNLSSLSLGSGLSTIGFSAFSGCPIDSLTISCANPTIGSSAFNLIGSSVHRAVKYLNYNCNAILDYISLDSISTLVIGNSITSVNPQQFKNRNALKTVIVGNSVTTLGYEAFQGCGSLIYVDMGSSVSSIGTCCFWDCTDLETIVFHSTTPPSLGLVYWGDGSCEVPFDYGCKILIPCGTYNNYYTAWTASDNNSTICISNTTTGQVYYWTSCIPLMVQEKKVNIKLYSLSNNVSMGTTAVNIDGEWLNSLENPYSVDCNNNGVIAAFPKNGYHFDHWSNGHTANPDTLYVTNNYTITAFFAPNQYTVTLNSENDSIGTVSGSGTYCYNDTVTIYATPSEHYHFVSWSDGNTNNPRVLNVTSDITLTASFSIDVFQVTVTSNNNNYGSVEGGGNYEYGTSCTIKATAKNGYQFDKWQDGNTDNPREIYVTENMSFIAFFKSSNTAINKHDEEITITTNQNLISIVGAAGKAVYMYDINGRLLEQKKENEERRTFDVPVSGAYLIKIGDLPARKVVVIR